MGGHNICQLYLTFALFPWIMKYIVCQYTATEQFNLEHLDKRLFGSGYAVATTVNYSLHKCARTCAIFGWCRSFNFRREFGFCEMNSINASEASDRNLRVDTEWDYYDIDKWLKLITGYCSADTCPKNHLCLHGGSNPSCIKIEDSIPDSCPDEWYPFNNKCFFVSFGRVSDTVIPSNTYIEPKPCEPLGANLAIMQNEEISKYLWELHQTNRFVRFIRINTDETSYKVNNMHSLVGVYMYTQHQETWIWLHGTGLDIKRRSSIFVQIYACHKASLALSTKDDSIEDGSYRIDLIDGSDVINGTTFLTKINILMYLNGTWLYQQERYIQERLLICGNMAFAAIKIQLSWFGKILRVGIRNAEDDFINEAIKEDFRHLAVLREIDNKYVFLRFAETWTLVGGPNGSKLRLSNNFIQNEDVIDGEENDAKYICEKPAAYVPTGG